MATLNDIALRTVLKLGDSAVGQFYSQAMVFDAVAEAYRYYSMKLIREGEGYFETTTGLNITANQEQVDLSTLTPTFWKSSCLWKKTTVGDVPLKKREKRYVVNSQIGVGNNDSYIPTYRFRGNNIILMPTPLVSETSSNTSGLKLDYVYIPIFPSSTSSGTFVFDTQYPSIYEINVVFKAVILLLSGKQAIGGVVDYSTFKDDLMMADNAMIDTMTKAEEPDEVQYVGETYNLG